MRHQGNGAFPVKKDGVTSSRFGATVFFNWRLAVSVDSQYSIVVQALELRAKSEVCVQKADSTSSHRRRDEAGTLQPEPIILATVLRAKQGCAFKELTGRVIYLVRPRRTVCESEKESTTKLLSPSSTGVLPISPCRKIAVGNNSVAWKSPPNF